MCTQKRYEYCTEDIKRPDMVFEDNDTLCFLENKVESQEGGNQLASYYAILMTKQEKKRSIHLRYCTKYYDPKEPPDGCAKDNFQQFRWSDVSEFLSKNENGNPLIDEFLTFLIAQHIYAVRWINWNIYSNQF